MKYELYVEAKERRYRADQNRKEDEKGKTEKQAKAVKKKNKQKQ